MPDDETRERATPDEGRSGEGPPAGALSAQEIDDLRKRAAQADEFREQMLLARADYANLQKRHDRESRERRRLFLKDTVAALLPALDDLTLACAADPAAEVPLRQGVEIALGKLDQALRGLGIERIKTAGEPFDPAVHEAVSIDARPDVKRPTVATEVGAGYRTGDLIIRPARVTVAVPLASLRQDSEQTDTSAET